MCISHALVDLVGVLYTGATERSQDVHNMLTTMLSSRRALRTSRVYMLIELAGSRRLTPSFLEEYRGDIGGVRHGTARSVVSHGGSGGFAGWGLKLLFVPPPVVLAGFLGFALLSFKASLV